MEEGVWEGSRVKLVQESRLVFNVGRTQKIYEIDLCEVGPGRFVVNFRYGRVGGGTIKEGSKTMVPVAEKNARAIFEKLEQSKRNAGYVFRGSVGASRPVSSPGASVSGIPRVASSSSRVSSSSSPALSCGSRSSSGPIGGAQRDTLVRFVMDRLRQGEVTSSRRFSGRFRRRAPAVWSLTRAIWRAGELAAQEAEPFLQGFLRGPDALSTYAASWALGRCGGESSIPHLNAVFADQRQPDHVRWIAAQSLRMLYSDAGRRVFLDSFILELPMFLRDALRAGELGAFQDVLSEHLVGDRPEPYRVLETLYMLESKVARAALLRELREAPLKPLWFRSFRRIFKAAELRRDAEVFGILAYRFETEGANFRVGSWSKITHSYMSSHSVPDEMRRRVPRVCFSDKTRNFLRRRVWTTLRRMGELEDPDYIKMAVGVLLPFTDADGGAERSYGRRTHWDRFARYRAFNHILYQHSPRYELRSAAAKAWRCRRGYRPGLPAPAQREEAFPGLWNRAPVGLLHLLDGSQCERVHEFAARALKAQSHFLTTLDERVAIMLLQAPYKPTVALGFELAKKLYSAARPHLAMVKAAALCADGVARRTAHVWVEEHGEIFARDGAFVAELLTSPWGDARLFAAKFLRGGSLSREVISGLVQGMVSFVTDAVLESEEQREGVVALLVQDFGAYLPSISGESLEKLLKGKTRAIQTLGAEVLVAKGGIPEREHLRALLSSSHAKVRAYCAQILMQLSEAELKNRPDLLMATLANPHRNVRRAVLPVFRRVRGDEGFVSTLLQGLLSALLDPKLPEEVAVSLVDFLQGEDFRVALQGVHSAWVWKLLAVSSRYIQNFGASLLAQHISLRAMSAEQVVFLGNHELAALRRAAHRALEVEGAPVLEDLWSVCSLVDSPWEDTRNVAMALIREKLPEDALSPAMMISICDSVQPDVQRFGRDLILRGLQGEAGEEYMVKLSEHPSPNVQLFVTSYLEKYAARRSERILELEPYFVRVLSRVNRGKVIKHRVFRFLLKEAREGDREAAEVIGRMMGRVSASMAVETREQALEVMTLIQRRFEDVEMPIRRLPVALRGGA